MVRRRPNVKHRCKSKRGFGGVPILTALALAALAGLSVVDRAGGAQIRGLAKQAAGTAQPSFEVVSIKLCKSRSPLPGIHLFNDRFNATSSALGLILSAYGEEGHRLSLDQVSGAEGWVRSDLYDVEGKVDDSLVDGAWKNLSFDQKWDQVSLMVRSLLADRFLLEVSHVTRERPVYELVLAKDGPKFKEDSTHLDVDALVAHGRGEFELISGDFKLFASMLSFQPELGGRVVLNRTGLTSHYSFTFRWTPETLSAAGGIEGDNGSSGEPAGPSLFTALQEQLGLKLVPAKGPVDVIVIDHIQRPSEN